MATGKKFYWIKLWESFMKGKEVDYLMDKPDGSKYVMLFLFLCVIAINTNGRLEEHVGQIVRPFSLAKLTRDLKFFSEDTIIVGLKLFQDTELISIEPDKTIVINNFGNLVGSETDWKMQKRLQRERHNLTGVTVKNLPGACGQNPDNTADSSVDMSAANADKTVDMSTLNADKTVDMSIQRNIYSSSNSMNKETTTTTTGDSGSCCGYSSDFKDVLSAAADAGFPESRGMIKTLREMTKEHGKTEMLYGIQACLRQNKSTIAYLEGCLKSRQEAANAESMPGYICLNQ